MRLTPSRFICRAGTTSLTVRSTRTPPMRRKHFRSGSSARASSNVESTRLSSQRNSVNENVLFPSHMETMEKQKKGGPTCVPLLLARVRLLWQRPLADHSAIASSFVGFWLKIDSLSAVATVHCSVVICVGDEKVLRKLFWHIGRQVGVQALHDVSQYLSRTSTGPQ